MRDGAWLDAQDFPPLDYAVDGLVPEGFSILIGPPKAGKSWLALEVLLAVACGGHALGKVHTGPPRRVLYLALEDGDRRMQDRCRALLDGHPIPELFHYLTRVRPGRLVATMRAFLKRYPDTGLIVVDTLGKVTPPAMPGEGAYQRDYRISGDIKAVADEHPGLTVTALHHDRKAASDDFVDSVSGTHGLAGAADTILVLARKRQAKDALLKVTGRDVPEAEYAVTLAESGRWTLAAANLDEAAELARQRSESEGRSETSMAIVQFVREHPDGVSAKDVANKFGDIAYRYLRRLADDAFITTSKRGWYTPT
ncbi:AAA domain-containing protein [Saccharopolyspora shandongensis]|uniref:AAA domain-containing protein n=1 Tax=Saccharopolyspora shandongensis TaxID=418495 RepID=A0A1H3DH05_9PSEU|nr:AAA domain-containing protein [Saccharopolyspora shandongensis]